MAINPQGFPVAPAPPTPGAQDVVPPPAVPPPTSSTSAPAPTPAPAPAPAPADPSRGFFATYWPHLTAACGALIAIGLGAGDHFSTSAKAWSELDLSLVWAGLGGLGITATSARAQG